MIGPHGSPTADPIRYEASALIAYATLLLQRWGCDPDVAGEVARHLVRADMSGQAGHGLLRVPQYFGQIERGELWPSARPRLVRDGGTTLVVDAQRGFGHFAMAFALSLLSERARQHGVACGALRQATHVGRLGEYTERCQESGLVLLASVGMAGTGVGGVAPFGGRERFMGANVWSIGVPGEDVAFVVDASLASIAVGKVHLARAEGRPLPEGCLADRGGRPSIDPEVYYAGGALLPMGGAVAGHKGYGLSMAAALLGALCMIGDPDPTLAGAPVREGAPAKGRAAGVFLIAIDPEAFGGASAYRSIVSDCVEAARGVASAPGVERVLVPGERSHAARERCAREGVRIAVPVRDELEAIGRRFGLAMPAPLGASPPAAFQEAHA